MNSRRAASPAATQRHVAKGSKEAQEEVAYRKKLLAELDAKETK